MTMVREEENYERLKNLAFREGGRLFGVAEIGPLKDRFLLSAAEMDGLEYGISMAVLLSPAVLDGIQDHPTLLYKWHYRQANNLLDKIAFLITQDIVEQGFRALPIPASQIIDWDAQRGAVSHRIVGEAAGLGWRGRNNLLVNARYGSRLRLVSVLTDLPLKTDPPAEGGCGSCRRCIEVCPAGALGNDWDAYDLEKCLNLLKEFSKMRGIGQLICGVCVKACAGNIQTRTPIDSLEHAG